MGATHSAHADAGAASCLPGLLQRRQRQQCAAAPAPAPTADAAKQPRPSSLAQLVVQCSPHSTPNPDSPVSWRDVVAALADAPAEARVAAAAGVGAPAPYEPHNGHVHGAPPPACHSERVAAADAINALRATRDGEIEGMLRLLCKVFEVETATCALLTGQAIYIVAACGALQSCVCPSRWGFCGWSFINSCHSLLVVEDMDTDARFSANFFVCDPAFNLKFYVAAPLLSSSGHRLGTLCVMGQQPRRFDALRGQLLSNLAEMIVRQLEQRWAAALLARGAPGLLRGAEAYEAAYLVLDLSAQPWAVLHMNEAAVAATGAAWGASYEELPCYSAGRRAAPQFDGLPLTALFSTAGSSLAWGASQQSWEFTLSGLAPVPEAAPAAAATCASWRLTFRPATADGLDEHQPFHVAIPAWLAVSDASFGRSLFFARLEPDDDQPSTPRSFAGDSVDSLQLLSGRLLAQQRGSAPSSRSSDGSTSAESLGAPAPGAWLPRGLSLPADAGDSRSLGSFDVGSCGHSDGQLKQQQQQQRRQQWQAGSAPSSNGSTASSSCRASGAGAIGPAVVAAAGGAALPIPGLLLGPLLGCGSWGRVYRGLLQGCPVAVKIVDARSLRCDAAGTPLEVALTRDLRQPALVSTLAWAYGPPLLGCGAARGKAAAAGGGGRSCWMVQELMDCGTHADAVSRGLFRTARHPLRGAPHLRVIAQTALELAAGMAHLHERGVMHGDLCGGNVLLKSCSVAAHGFTAKVADFGLARGATRDGRELHPVESRLQSNAYGTITHAAPEVLLGGSQAFTPAADTYSWGVCLWEMVTGSRAWAGLSAPAIVCQVAVLKRSLAMPRQLPPLLADLLARSLSAAPECRPTFACIVETLTPWVQTSLHTDWDAWQAQQDALVAAEAAAIAAADAAADAAVAAPSACPLAAGGACGGAAAVPA